MTALVTGGGTGIGRAVAVALAARGHHVVVVGRRPQPLADTAELIRSRGGTAGTSAIDVCDDVAMDQFVDDLCREQRLDVVVASAGVFQRSALADMPPDMWRAQVEINLTGAFVTLRSAVRAMRRQELVDHRRGHIFTVNSGAGVRGFPTGSAYAASKHGLRGLVDSLRPEVAGDAIKVTDIVVAATVESEMSAGRDVPMISAETVAHTVVACMDLPGSANWDRVDLAQLN